jgi:hypothetical protein
MSALLSIRITIYLNRFGGSRFDLRNTNGCAADRTPIGVPAWSEYFQCHVLNTADIKALKTAFKTAYKHLAAVTGGR